VRDWIHARDHAAGIWTALTKGTPGEVYNVGGGNERENMWITRRVLELTDGNEDLITYVEDRPGHDLRYSLDCTKLKKLGWQPEIAFEDGLQETADWYKARRDWWEPIKSGEFREWFEQQYKDRLVEA
jgi:dTDP-glucose 4,6-dehydratase